MRSESTNRLQNITREIEAIKQRCSELDIKLQQIDENDTERKRSAIIKEQHTLCDRLVKLNDQCAELGQHALHFSDIFEVFIHILPKPRKSLQELLEDWFIPTETGNWRPPLTEKERARVDEGQKADFRRQVRRICKLIQNGEAIPAGLLPDAPTMAMWIRECKRNGLFVEGVILYEMGGIDAEKLSDDVAVRLVEDYNSCKRRAVS